MATFNQDHQTVNNQYNAGRDINFSSAQSRDEIVQDLKHLLEEVNRASQAGALRKDVAIDVEANLRKAVLQAEEPQPDKKSILDYLNAARGLVEGVASAAGLVTGLVQAAQAVGRIL
ncbi:MAG: hypothetical protein ACM3XO_05225 [Bacteroidota bacterium]